MATITLPTREEWLAERKTGLGGSDVPVVLGLVPSKTPFQLWAEKCDLLPEEDLAATIEAVDWGLRLQGEICKGFADRTGREVVDAHPYEIIRDDEHPFLFASLDALQAREGELGVLEAKNVGTYMAHDWADGNTPLRYQVQVQAQLRCTEFRWGSIAALVGGNKLVYRDLQRDDQFLESAIPHLQEFWWHVQNRVPPPVDASPITARVLATLHPDDDGSTVELPAEAQAWHEALTTAKEEIKRQQDIAKLNENKLRAAIGSSTFGQLPGGECYSFKTQTRKSYTVKDSKFRVLRKMGG